MIVFVKEGKEAALREARIPQAYSSSSLLWHQCLPRAELLSKEEHWERDTFPLTSGGMCWKSSNRYQQDNMDTYLPRFFFSPGSAHSHVPKRKSLFVSS